MIRVITTATPTEQLTRDGYVVLPGFLPAGLLEEVRRLVDEELAGGSDAVCERPNNTLAPLGWDHPILDQLGAGVATVREATGAADLRFISAYISVKDPSSPALWWHQDWWCWQHPATQRPDPVQVAVLCYLQDTDASTGALRVIPGTHVRSVDLHAGLPTAHASEAAALDERHEAMRDHPEQVTLSVRAGDAVVTDYRLLHGTHPNRAARRRDCILMSFTPAWSELSADLRRHLIRHPALPADGEAPGAEHALAQVLPEWAGPRRDLELQRDAPASFSFG